MNESAAEMHAGPFPMRRAAAMIVMLSFLTANAGCGTMANLDGRDHWFMCLPSRPPAPFGGVINDGAVLLTPAVVGDGALIFKTLALIDMPLSLAADVITLPWATYAFCNDIYVHPNPHDNAAASGSHGDGPAAASASNPHPAVLGPPRSAAPDSP